MQGRAAGPLPELADRQPCHMILELRDQSLRTHANNTLVCCIYHAPKQSIDDSSSDSSSSDDSDSSNEDAGPRRIGGGGPGKKRGRGHKHDKDFGHGKGDKRPSPNAYEKMPRYKPKGGAGSGGEIKGPQ